ncbi:hypothetical protein [Streptosporangium sp. NPDC049376]|uniref:hypothetical protein n=1 Tax=Streptosporangium sp. NPDC049376 TaxID=3366192 RepID=UPI003789B074
MRLPGTPKTRALVMLLGGRAAFRGTVLLSNLALLAAWGANGYADYAQAMGSMMFLAPLASIGIEKCALKLIPRLRPTVASLLVGVFVTLCALLLTVALTVLATTVALGHSGHWATAGLAGLYAICVGLTQVMVGLSRALGKPKRDVAAHLTLCVALACWTVVVVVLKVSPVTFLTLTVATMATVNVVLLVMLRPRFDGLRRPTLVRAAMRTSLLMAIPDLVGGLSMSLLFVALSVTGARAESTGLYMASVASALLLNAFSYLLRVLQPDVSRSLNQRDLTATYDRLSRWLRLLVLAGVVYVPAVLALALAVLRPYGGAGVVIVYAACVPVIFAVGSANYVMENASAGALAATSAGAAVSLVAVGALAFSIVPWAGALGAVTVLAFGELVHALVILRWLRTLDKPASHILIGERK